MINRIFHKGELVLIIFCFIAIFIHSISLYYIYTEWIGYIRQYLVVESVAFILATFVLGIVICFCIHLRKLDKLPEPYLLEVLSCFGLSLTICFIVDIFFISLETICIKCKQLTVYIASNFGLAIITLVGVVIVCYILSIILKKKSIPS